jgi:glycolate oxidase
MNEAAFNALQQAAGQDNISQETGDRLLYATDGTCFRHPPEAVIRARDEDQISRVMAACTAHRVPVVPRGAGSGLTGGALPVAGGVVLDMVGMNRIIAIRPSDQVAVVQPGVVTGDLQEAAQAKGLFYPPDPASTSFCTLGGNVAENAGGLRAVKYGVTRDYVLGIKAVLPDGRLFRTGGANLKSVVGYDLTRLLVGSEGTLAVVYEITLRLLPLPEASATINAFYASLQEAAQGVQALLASGIRPVACEFMDAYCLKAVDAYAKLDLPKAEAMILVDLDGPPEVVQRQSGEVAEILRGAGGNPVNQAKDQAEVDKLWKARRAMGPAVYQHGPGKLNEDLAVPLGNLAEMVKRAHAIGEERGLIIAVFGHAGDGNLHVNVMHDPADHEQLEQAEQAVTDLFAHCLSLGGTLSGEHGVGTTKLGFVGAEIDPVALELMRQIKEVFDPSGILNPHKKLPSSEAMS